MGINNGTRFLIALIVAVSPAAIFAASGVTAVPVVVEPVRVNLEEIEQKIGAQAYMVLDRTTGKILTMKQENRVWPIASLTKLMTADVVLDHQVPKTKIADVRTIDDVGGARLSVKNGDTFSVDDLFYATLIASANNAANALSRTTGLEQKEFVKEMNQQAVDLNLTHTTFVDPTGIDPRNVSTVSDLAQFARKVFDREEIRHYTTTTRKNITVLNRKQKKMMTTTNWMLYKPAYDDVWVTGGKTGYLEESGWNLVVSLQPNAKDQDRELLMVIFGADSRADSFVDAKKLSKWAWAAYDWQKVD